MSDEQRAAWEAFEAGCSGLLARRCKHHRPYIGCPLDCTDVENAIEEEWKIARPIVVAMFDEIELLRSHAVEHIRSLEALTVERDRYRDRPEVNETEITSMRDLERALDAAEAVSALLQVTGAERDRWKLKAAAGEVRERMEEENVDEILERESELLAAYKLAISQRDAARVELSDVKDRLRVVEEQNGALGAVNEACVEVEKMRPVVQAALTHPGKFEGVCAKLHQALIAYASAYEVCTVCKVRLRLLRMSVCNSPSCVETALRRFNAAGIITDEMAESLGLRDTGDGKEP